MKKIYFIAVVVLVFSFFLFPAYSFAGEDMESLQRPTWKVGLSWVYDVTVTEYEKVKKYPEKRTVAEVNDTGYIVSLDNVSVRKEVYSKDLNFVLSMDKNNNMVKEWNPELAIFVWPLKSNGSWQKTCSYRDKNSLIPENFTFITRTAGEEILTINGKEIVVKKFETEKQDKRGNFAGRITTWYDPQSFLVVRSVDVRLRGKYVIERNLVSVTLDGTK